MMRATPWWIALVVVVVVARGRVAHAQSDGDLAGRRQLLEQAEAAAAAGDHARALELARRAAAIRLTTSLRAMIAEEAQAAGELVEAFNTSTVCVHEAETDATLTQREVIRANCRAVVAATAPRIGRLTVRLPAAAPPDLRILVAGHPLNPAFYGVPYVVAPGTTVVEVTAPGFVVFQQRVGVSAGGTSEVSVVLVPSVGASARTRPRGGPGAGPFVVMGAGAVGLGLAALFYGLSTDALHQVDRLCAAPDGMGVQRCADFAAAQGAYEQGGTWNTATNAALIGGGVVLAGGAAWLLGSLLRSDTPPRARAMVAPTRAGLMVVLEGAL